MKLRRIILSLYALLFLATPLILSTITSEMFEFPKMLMIYVLSSCITLLTVMYVMIDPRRARWHMLLTLYTIFLASQIHSTFWSMDQHTSIFGYYGRFNGGILSLIAYGGLLWSAIQVFDYRSYTIMLWVSLVTCVLVILWGLPARFLGFDSSCVLLRHEHTISCWTDEFRPKERMFSTLGQPNWLGAYVSAHFFLALFVMFRRESKARCMRYLRFAVLFLLAAGVYFTASRSAEIALVVGLGIVFWQHVIQPKSKATQLKILAIVMTILIIGTVWYMRGLKRNQNAAITDSGTIRLIVWEGAWKLFLLHPLVGTGPETFAYVYPLTRPAAHNLTSEKDFIYNKAHNEFINYLATTGLIGLLTYLVFHGYVLRKLYQTQNHPLLAALLAIHITNFFGFSTTTTQLILYIVPIVLAIDHPTHRHLPPIKRPFISFAMRSLVVVLALGVWIYTMIYIAQYLLADVEYNHAQNLYQNDEPYQAIDLYTRALELRYEHVYLDKLALASAQSAYLFSEVAAQEPEANTQDIELMKHFENLAVLLENKLVATTPQNPFYWKDRARVYILLLQFDTDDKARHAKYYAAAERSIAMLKKLAPTDLDNNELQKLLKE